MNTEMGTSNASTIPNFEGPTVKGYFEIKDPWKNRSAGMRCQTCMWYVPKAGAPVSIEKGSFGRCRRHAPTMGGYPAVFGMDWCGDHRLDENKA
jgi:Pyruvate/2-oxoacid:ferredoxin oxidoreductase delta subunit